MGHIKLTGWTQAAIDCYKRNCRCKGCPIYEIIKDKCKMTQTVIQLVKEFGVPTGKEIFRGANKT